MRIQPPFSTTKADAQPDDCCTGRGATSLRVASGSGDRVRNLNAVRCGARRGDVRRKERRRRGQTTVRLLQTAGTGGVERVVVIRGIVQREREAKGGGVSNGCRRRSTGCHGWESRTARGCVRPVRSCRRVGGLARWVRREDGSAGVSSRRRVQARAEAGAMGARGKAQWLRVAHCTPCSSPMSRPGLDVDWRGFGRGPLHSIVAKIACACCAGA